MDAARKSTSFVVTLILTAFAASLFCAPLAADCMRVLQHGYGTRQYLTAAAGGGGVAALSRDGAAFRLTLGTLDGKRTDVRTYRLPVDAVDCTVCALYPAADGTAFLAVYERVDDVPDSHLALYRLPVQGAPERLLYEPCVGDTVGARRKGTYLSGFLEEGGRLSFAMIRNGQATVYTGATASGGLEQGAAQNITDYAAAAVLPDGTLVRGGTEWLILDDKQSAFSLDGRIVTHLTQTASGLYYLDGASLQVFYCDPVAYDTARVLDLSADGLLDDLTGLSIVGNGSVLLLRGGHTLTLVHRDGMTDLTGMLYRSQAQCALILLGLTLGILLAAAGLWYLACGRRRSYLPFAVRWGCGLAVIALTAGLFIHMGAIRPRMQDGLLREVERVLGGVSEVAAGSGTPDDAPRAIERGLSAVRTGAYGSASARVYTRGPAGAWITADAVENMPAGCRAALVPGFSGLQADMAMRAGTAIDCTGERFRFCRSQDGQVLQITVAAEPLARDMQAARYAITSRMWASLALLWAAAVLSMLLVGRQLHRLGRAMERLAEGGKSVRVMLRTGDELEGLADSFNSMARAMLAREQEIDSLIRAYLRFVPERVLALLGKASVLEVDKHTFAARRMSTMTVGFAFPGQVYDGDTRDLFDSINQVIERTAAIVVRKGGTVFNFAYNGYDVVLTGDTQEMVSTAVAVQQEVLALNAARAAAGQPAVTLRIALDVGEVMLGVVGDETQMEPATISSSFAAARRLIGLCDRLDAGILCTERVIGGAAGYGSRYMGKSVQNGEAMRVYEIFDGDPFAVRRSKERTGERFSQGIFALYSREFSAAKRIFLELVHENSDDGGARYYLYQADRLEKHPDQELGLDT